MRLSNKLARVIRIAIVTTAMAPFGHTRAQDPMDPLPSPQYQPLADLGWDSTASGKTDRLKGDHITTIISRGEAPVTLAYSLGGLKAVTPLDFSAPFGGGILAEHQPRVVALKGTVSGKGSVVLSEDSELLGELTLTDEPTGFRFALAGDSATTISITAPADTDATFSTLNLEIATSEIAIEQWTLLTSYAKFARNFSDLTGLVRDRSTVPPDTFDAVPASGMFALAAAAMADAGFVERGYADAIFEQVSDSIAMLPTYGGMLPHFAAAGGAAEGSEYSTIDTAIYYHAMLGAAHILGKTQASARMHDEIRALNFTRLRLPEGYLSHGYTVGGDVIPYNWRDWGGESALVVALERMSDPDSKSMMAKDGRVYEGIGFIAEIASLFYPQFDLEEPDEVTGNSWKAVRKQLAEAQRRYTKETNPSSPAAMAGFYGYSAGDGKEPGTYGARGSDVPGLSWIHPHYLLMATAAHYEADEARTTLHSLVQHDLLRPWGLVEGFDPYFDTINAANVSLNAAFETLAAYHLNARLNGTRDAIYEATEDEPFLRAGIRRFYSFAVALR